MAADDPQATIRIGADDEPLRRALRELLTRMSAFGDASKAQLKGVGDSTEGLRTKLMGLTAVLSGGAIVAYLKHTVDLQDELSKAAQKAGTTTEAFSSMNYAAKLADVSTEELVKAYSKLNGVLTEGQTGKKEAVELFRSIGVDPQKVKDSDQLLLILAERFEKMEDGARKSALAAAFFGEKLGPGLIPFLNSGKDGIEALRLEAEKLGVVISTEQGKQAEEFNDNLTRMGTAARGAANSVMRELIPSLVRGSEYFVKATKDAGLLEGALISIGALMAKVTGLDDEGRIGRDLKMAKEEASLLKSAVDQLGRSVENNPFSTTFRAQLEERKRQLEDVEKRVRSLQGELYSLHGAGTSQAGAGRGSINPDPAIKSGSDWNPPRDDKSNKGPATPQSDMPKYELLLAQERRVRELLDGGRQYTKEQELEFWKTIGQAANLTANDRISVSRKVYQLETDIERQSAQDRIKIDADAAQAVTQFALGKVDAQRQAAQSALDIGAITSTQMLALEVQFEQQRYSIQRAALEQRLELLAQDPTLNAVELARVKNEILALEQQHETQRAALLSRVRGEQLQGQDGPVSALGDPSTWDSYFGRLLQSANGWRAGMMGIFSSIAQAFLQQLVIRPLAEYAAGLARMLLVKLGFLSAERAAQTASSAATVGIKASEATAVAGANAVEAGTGAAAAVAPTPFVGPILAIAAMAAVFAAVMAMASRKSAAGGYDIPAGVNPVTQLHEEEMVLPSPLANAVRRMAGDGGEGGSGGDTYALQATPLDGGFWMVHESSFVRFFDKLQRNKRVRTS